MQKFFRKLSPALTKKNLQRPCSQEEQQRAKNQNEGNTGNQANKLTLSPFPDLPAWDPKRPDPQSN